MHADKKANANSALKKIRKIHLTRSSVCTLLFCCRAAAIAFAPSSPTWLPCCKTHVGPQARRQKSKREFKKIKTSAKFILQGSANKRCCCVAERQQLPSLLRRRLGCLAAKLMLALKHADKKANANSALKTIRKIHLTSSSVCTLLFCCRAAAIAFAPSSPTWFSFCKTHVGPQARRQKSKREFSAKNHPQNS
jgi:hypothetical protein